MYTPTVRVAERCWFKPQDYGSWLGEVCDGSPDRSPGEQETIGSGRAGEAIGRKQKREIHTYRFPTGGASSKEPACQSRRYRRCGFNAWLKKIPWRRKRQPIPVFLPGESHGQRDLGGYGPQGHKESDMTEVTWHACTF